jgi:hypothetical protein
MRSDFAKELGLRGKLKLNNDVIPTIDVTNTATEPEELSDRAED